MWKSSPYAPNSVAAKHIKQKEKKSLEMQGELDEILVIIWGYILLCFRFLKTSSLGIVTPILQRQTGRLRITCHRWCRWQWGRRDADEGVSCLWVCSACMNVAALLNAQVWTGLFVKTCIQSLTKLLTRILSFWQHCPDAHDRAWYIIIVRLMFVKRISR